MAKGIFRSQKVGGVKVVPVTSKILTIFVSMMLLSNLAANLISIVLSQRQTIELTNTILVDKLKELYTNAGNQWQIYQYSQKKDECFDSLRKVAQSGFKYEHSVAMGVDMSGKIQFIALNENDNSGYWSAFSDTEALAEMNGAADGGVTEGSVVFRALQGEYFGVYKYQSEWNFYLVRAEMRRDTQAALWKVFFINTIIIAVLTLMFALIGVALLRRVLRNIPGFTKDLFAMQRQRQLSLIDLSKAPNDDITYLAASFNSLSFSVSNLLNTFQKFVSKDVAAKAYEENGIALEGKQRELTILFSDIKSFTYRTETLGNEIITLLNVHYDKVIHIAHENQGVIGSIIGDAILAIYGTENADALKSLSAIKSAWEITTATERLRREMTARKSEIEKRRPLTDAEEKVYKAVLIDVGVGIDGGTVFYGNIGSEEHMANTVIGDNVNSASRLEGLTRVYRLPVIVSEYIKEEVESVTGRYRFHEIDTVQVKGKAKGKKIFFPLDTERFGSDVDSRYEIFERGLRAYYDGDWSAARSHFKESGLDVADVFIERIGLKSAPEGWDGIWTMTTK